MALAARVRKVAGMHNMVGIYHPSCFVAVVPVIQFPSMLRSLGLRLANSLRKPLTIRTRQKADFDFKADVGVGITRISREIADAAYVLEEAEGLAQAARNFASRVAIRSLTEVEIMPVEKYHFRAVQRDSTAARSPALATHF